MKKHTKDKEITRVKRKQGLKDISKTEALKIISNLEKNMRKGIAYSSSITTMTEPVSAVEFTYTIPFEKERKDKECEEKFNEKGEKLYADVKKNSERDKLEIEIRERAKSYYKALGITQVALADIHHTLVASVINLGDPKEDNAYGFPSFTTRHREANLAELKILNEKCEKLSRDLKELEEINTYLNDDWYTSRFFFGAGGLTEFKQTLDRIEKYWKDWKKDIKIDKSSGEAEIGQGFIESVKKMQSINEEYRNKNTTHAEEEARAEKYTLVLKKARVDLTNAIKETVKRINIYFHKIHNNHSLPELNRHMKCLEEEHLEKLNEKHTQCNSDLKHLKEIGMFLTDDAITPRIFSSERGHIIERVKDTLDRIEKDWKKCIHPYPYPCSPKTPLWLPPAPKLPIWSPSSPKVSLDISATKPHRHKCKETWRPLEGDRVKPSKIGFTPGWINPDRPVEFDEKGQELLRIQSYTKDEIADKEKWDAIIIKDLYLETKTGFIHSRRNLEDLDEIAHTLSAIFYRLVKLKSQLKEDIEKYKPTRIRPQGEYYEHRWVEIQERRLSTIKFRMGIIKNLGEDERLSCGRITKRNLDLLKGLERKYLGTKVIKAIFKKK